MDYKITPKLITFDDLMISGCFNISDTVKEIEEAFLNYKKGLVDLPDKISQIFDDTIQNRINCMPATLIDKKICGVKWVSVFPNNPNEFNCPNVSGLIVLSNTVNGYPIAIMDGTLITALRTACVGALGAKYLAKSDSEVYSTIGTGEQAKMHFIAIKELFPSIKVCKIASRNKDSELRFINELKEKYTDVNFIPYESDYEMVAKDADIIVTAVSCQRPLLKANSIKKGAFYCHVGGYEDEYEVALKADKIVCDSWESVKHRTQTISQLYKIGKITDDDIYADISEIIDGTVVGRENDQEFIYFNSVGLAFLDVSIAYSFYKKVLENRSGIDWPLQRKNFWEYFEN